MIEPRSLFKWQSIGPVYNLNVVPLFIVIIISEQSKHLRWIEKQIKKQSAAAFVGDVAMLGSRYQSLSLIRSDGCL